MEDVRVKIRDQVLAKTEFLEISRKTGKMKIGERFNSAMQQFKFLSHNKR